MVCKMKKRKLIRLVLPFTSFPHVVEAGRRRQLGLVIFKMRKEKKDGAPLVSPFLIVPVRGRGAGRASLERARRDRANIEGQQQECTFLPFATAGKPDHRLHLLPRGMKAPPLSLFCRLRCSSSSGCASGTAPRPGESRGTLLTPSPFPSLPPPHQHLTSPHLVPRALPPTRLPTTLPPHTATQHLYTGTMADKSVGYYAELDLVDAEGNVMEKHTVVPLMPSQVNSSTGLVEP